MPASSPVIDIGAVVGGFADPVHDAQGCYRVLLEALARPAQPRTLQGLREPPAPLYAATAAIALTLFDRDTPIWIGASLASSATTACLRFHTGCPIVAEPHAAAFALVTAATELEPLDRFAFGTDVAPETGATVIAQVDAFARGGLTARGPGIRDSAAFGVAGLPDTFVASWQRVTRAFPRGVDLLLVAPDAVAALPRTTRLEG